MLAADLDQCFKSRRIAAVDFAAGVSTPLLFSDARREHLATRRSAGLFDFSFMSCMAIRGAQSLDLLERIQVRDLRRLAAGSIAYTLMCREDGTVIDDATVWCRAAGDYWLVAGVGVARTHVERIAAGYDAEVIDRSASQAVLSLQGPASFRILQRVLPSFDIATLPYFRFRNFALVDTSLCLARVGDGGELGYELVVAAKAGPALWQRLVAAGAPQGLLECGFAAGDSLRIEAGHLLFGGGLAVTPFELGLGRLVRRDGARFLGAAALSALRFAAPRWRLAGLLPAGRGDADQAAPLAAADIAAGFASIRAGVAHLHYGCTSPILDRPIGLGFVAEADRHPGTRVALADGRTARVARLPFYDPAKTLPRLAVAH